MLPVVSESSAPGESALPPSAADLFGNRLDVARQYAAILADAGTAHGLIGPREVPRLWDRHLLNCAVLADLIPSDARVLDVGSGAGLPGLVLAIRRPDLQLVLIEPMERRVRFLTAAVTQLGLRDNVRIAHGRAPDIARDISPASWVVARAVAPLQRLVPQCAPLCRPQGWLLAMKGTQLEAEVHQAEQVFAASGVLRTEVREVGAGVLAEPTRVLALQFGRQRAERSRRSKRGASS